LLCPLEVLLYEWVAAGAATPTDPQDARGTGHGALPGATGGKRRARL